jgi:hypothetical protein
MSSSQALVCYIPQRLLILQRIAACEAAVLLASHPHDIVSILDDLKLIEALIVHLGDWGLYPRLQCVRHQARSVMFRQCHALLHRCAELVDAGDEHFCTNQPQLPSYADMAMAVSACDDVLHFLVPTFKQFYREDIRPRLVACMEDSASSTPVSASVTASKAASNDSASFSSNESEGGVEVENDDASIGSWHIDQSARTGSSCVDVGPAVPSAKRMRMTEASGDFLQSPPDSSSPLPVHRPTVALVLSCVCDCVRADLGGGCYDAANCPCKENHAPHPHHTPFVSRWRLGKQQRNSQQHSS